MKTSLRAVSPPSSSSSSSSLPSSHQSNDENIMKMKEETNNNNILVNDNDNVKRNSTITTTNKTAKTTTNTSWRSTGWTPLAYPSSALYQYNNKNNTTTTTKKRIQMNHWELNPYFPLHKDVILAATRELLILDGSLDPKTLSVKSTEDDPPTTTTTTTTTEMTTPVSTIDTDTSILLHDKESTTGIKCKTNHCGKRKRNNIISHIENTKHVSFVDQFHRKKVKLDSQGGTKQQQQQQQEEEVMGEDLAQFIVEKCIWDYHDDNEMGSNNNSDFPSVIRLSTSTDSNEQHSASCNNSNTTHTTNTATTGHDEDPFGKGSNMNSLRRPRKVSDDFTFVSSYPLSSNISPHLVVIAMNMSNTNNDDITALDSIKKLVGDDIGNQEVFLLEQKNNLPRLLDVSIMTESHLRKMAYIITERLTCHFDDKAKREFLGYKSASLKNDRIIHLISDFLFDVSHAMFAWDQTEAELYGTYTDNIYNASGIDDQIAMIRDKKICDELFDERALRKIGGFDASSLLYHAVTMKRLRGKEESWAIFAKSALGKKMLRHHFDDHSRVQVGQLRRGQRIRKSRSAFHPMTTACSNVNDRALKLRSRSSSFVSEVSNDHKHDTDHDVDPNNVIEYEKSLQLQSTIPDTSLITVSRQDTSKSWGILLAKEGSMCIVMRVPVPSNEHQNVSDHSMMLQKGDLIVSVCNEHNEMVNTTQHNGVNTTDWFDQAVGLFKRSCTLHLVVRRVSSTH